MNVIDKCPMKGRNTFGIEASADILMEFSSENELRECLSVAKHPVMVIGSGSNLLFMGDYQGTILHSAIKGIDVIENTDEYVLVRVGSGMIWDDFAAYCADNGWWGAENLTAVPGEVGASAVQNIGAYGVEVCDIISEVRAMSISDYSVRTFACEDCRYGYRTSIFKSELKGQYVVTSVVYRLKKQASPNLEYGALRQTIEGMGEVSLHNIRAAVRRIRESKLPDPAVLGNAGSFFINPVISDNHYREIRSRYPDVPSYPSDGDMCKVPAGWLIEKCGWKGRSLGPAAVHDRQALVLVNKGGATGRDIKALADAIIADVRDRFGIELKTEVNYIS